MNGEIIGEFESALPPHTTHPSAYLLKHCSKIQKSLFLLKGTDISFSPTHLMSFVELIYGALSGFGQTGPLKVRCWYTELYLTAHRTMTVLPEDLCTVSTLQISPTLHERHHRTSSCFTLILRIMPSAVTSRWLVCELVGAAWQSCRICERISRYTQRHMHSIRLKMLIMNFPRFFTGFVKLGLWISKDCRFCSTI